jgi:hypothetical protein
MTTTAKLYHLCDYCANCFGECKSNPKFIIDHPQFADLYAPDAKLHHNDLIYECDGFVFKPIEPTFELPHAILCLKCFNNGIDQEMDIGPAVSQSEGLYDGKCPKCGFAFWNANIEYYTHRPDFKLRDKEGMKQ